MTKQEVEQSLPFRAARKILKKTYPWITRIEAPEDAEKYSTLIFLNIYFDPYKLQEEVHGYKIDPFYLKYSKNQSNPEIWGSSNMAAFFLPEDPNVDTKRKLDELRYITDDVLKILKAVSKSDIYPYELRLANNKIFDISNFHIDPNTI